MLDQFGIEVPGAQRWTGEMAGTNVKVEGDK
jgi:hypothetical protein